ncbi:MAG: hypothetical protein FAZ92_03738 [Accumulibacter sp.]|jgi:hypothetical protein|uniref:bestrophin-like domain n=1 Tax=Accumulibacter sp. TaxID=2053492 RepID=UPI001224702B|nr:DUF4239 domain-containing protein [Accumulibacter sp.]QKS29959.1 MAG: DUF4239 domain-containing protein [Candidatus Accumulibacter similis]TLD44029.1 MAG: hypothetical protein FAZ92_03738 [Accumulibacter sp.]
MNWLHELSSLELAAFVIGVVALLSVAGVALVAPRVRSSGLHQHFDNGTIAGLLSALIGVYAVAAGLTAVAVWGNMVDAGSDVSREAAAIAVLYHDLGGYPPPLQQQGRRALVAYTRYVINVEWPLHQKGQLPRDTLRIIEKAQRSIISFEPVTEGQKIVQAAVLRSYNHLLQAHWQRVQAVRDTALPAELWIVVILLGSIAISSCFLLRVDSFAMHATVTLLVAAPIALVLYFIAVSDHPFQGGINVSPAPYREVLEKMLLLDDVEQGAEAAASGAAVPPQ